MVRSFFLPALVLAAASAAGCGMFAPGPAPGTVTGIVLFNGAPAAGKQVSLLPGGMRTRTDQSGRYRFANVPAGTYSVFYLGRPKQVKIGDPLPNEVAEWRTAPVEMAAGIGRELPAFDVAYNGLLYPDEAMSLIVKPDSPVPFHWSPHLQGRQYRVKVTSETTNPWYSAWSGEPTAIFAQEVPVGRYHWSVEIDAFERGTGATSERQVDF